MFVTQILSRSESIDLEYWPIMSNPCISTYQFGLICKSALQCFLPPGGIYHLETGRVEFLGRSPKHQDWALLHWVYSNALLKNYERLDWIIPLLDHGFKLRYITQFDDFDGYIVAADIFEELRHGCSWNFGRSPSFFASRRLMHFVPLCSTLFQELLASKGNLPPSMQIPGHTFACGRAYWPAVETAHSLFLHITLVDDDNVSCWVAAGSFGLRQFNFVNCQFNSCQCHFEFWASNGCGPATAT